MSDIFQIVIMRKKGFDHERITLTCKVEKDSTNVFGTDRFALLVDAEIEANRTGVVRIHINEK